MSSTVAKALEVVKFIAKKERTLLDVAEFLGAHRSTAFRLLQTLEEGGFVRRNAAGAYAIGYQLIALGQLGLDEVEVRTAAHPYLVRLSEQTGHTVHLGQLVDDHVVYVDKIDGQGSISLNSRIGVTVNTHTAGVAKVIAANVDATTRDRLLDAASFERYTTATITDRAVLERELAEARERGWAEDAGEDYEYINCVAVPVRDSGGAFTLGISVTTLRAAAPLEELRLLVPQLQETGREVSRALGWTEAH